MQALGQQPSLVLLFFSLYHQNPMIYKSASNGQGGVPTRESSRESRRRKAGNGTGFRVLPYHFWEDCRIPQAVRCWLA
jgi:hypothetical protein